MDFFILQILVNHMTTSASKHSAQIKLRRCASPIKTYPGILLLLLLFCLFICSECVGHAGALGGPCLDANSMSQAPSRPWLDPNPISRGLGPNMGQDSRRNAGEKIRIDIQKNAKCNVSVEAQSQNRGWIKRCKVNVRKQKKNFPTHG